MAGNRHLDQHSIPAIICIIYGCRSYPIVLVNIVLEYHFLFVRELIMTGTLDLSTIREAMI